MRYLNLNGEIRSFRALFNGKNFYCPEKIPPVGDEILIERSHSLRLQAFLSPYLDTDLRLHQCLPSISPNAGSLSEPQKNVLLFSPRLHLLELPFRLLAALLETFRPELLEKPLHYFASSPAEAAAFCAGFPVEKKYLYMPSGISAPKTDDLTSVYSLPDIPLKEYTALKDKFLLRLELRMDGLNFLRTLGLAALMIHGIFLAGEKKLWFYGDEFNLAVPADNMETLTAAFLLAQSGLPIRKVFAVSTQNRGVYGLISKGGFNPSGLPFDAAFYGSLSRFLYEISKGSMPKVAGWQENLRQKGSLMVDSGSHGIIQKKIEAHFASPALLAESSCQSLSKLAQAACVLSENQQIPTFVFDEEGDVPASAAPVPIGLDTLFAQLHGSA